MSTCPVFVCVFNDTADKQVSTTLSRVRLQLVCCIIKANSHSGTSCTFTRQLLRITSLHIIACEHIERRCKNIMLFLKRLEE